MKERDRLVVKCVCRGFILFFALILYEKSTHKDEFGKGQISCMQEKKNRDPYRAHVCMYVWFVFCRKQTCEWTCECSEASAPLRISFHSLGSVCQYRAHASHSDDLLWSASFPMTIIIKPTCVWLCDAVLVTDVLRWRERRKSGVETGFGCCCWHIGGNTREKSVISDVMWFGTVRATEGRQRRGLSHTHTHTHHKHKHHTHTCMLGNRGM